MAQLIKHLGLAQIPKPMLNAQVVQIASTLRRFDVGWCASVPNAGVNPHWRPATEEQSR